MTSWIAMVIKILLYLILFACLGWGANKIFKKQLISLDQQKKNELQYSNLPISVQEGFVEGLADRPTDWEVVVVNLDSSYAELRHFRERGKLFVGGDHLIINEVHFKFSYKKGDPFILYKKHLYYPEEYGLAIYNLESTIFFSINLSEFLVY